MSTAILAGGLLAFALSFDEVVVTFFTAGAQNTLPLLIYGFIRQGQNLPIVNAIALVVIVVTAVPGLHRPAVDERHRRRDPVGRRSAAAAET